MFREGDAIDGVFFVQSGTVQIERRREGADIVLGMVGAGQYLGEMGVVEGRERRTATARALIRVEAEVVTADEFLTRISRSESDARAVLERLSARLHELEDRYVKGPDYRSLARGASQLGAEVTVRGLVLSPKGAELLRQMRRPRVVESLPFVVGRAVLPAESKPPRQCDLELEDRVPLRLSRNHFAIFRRRGRLLVRDLRSTLGTAVNGKPIGEHFTSDEAELMDGRNEIVAGGLGSPFVFDVSIEHDEADGESIAG